MLNRPTINLQLFSLEMATFLNAGLSIHEALDLLAQRLKSPNERSFAGNLRDAILRGNRLSDAIEELGANQSAVLVALVRSAEQSGRVPAAFERFASYRQRLLEAQRKIATAMIYPVILVIAGLGVLAFLLLYVIPRFSQVYSDVDRDLPMASQWLMLWGEWVSAHPQTVMAMGICAVIGFCLVVFVARARQELLELLLGVSFVQPQRRSFELGRFYYTVGLLLDSGLPMLEAVQLSVGVLGSRYKAAYQMLISQIELGNPLADSLEAAGLSTDIAARLVKSGEGAGSVSTMLSRCGLIHEEDTWRQLERFTKIFEPVGMIVLGVLIGGLVVLMYLPIFELTQAID